MCSACGVTQLYQIGTLAGAQTLSSTEYAFFTASVAGSSTAVLGPLSSGFLPMFVGISSSAGSISKMCFEAASSTPGTLWSTLSSMGVAVKIQTDDANLQSKLQTAFGLQKLSGVACATGASSCVTSAVITSNIPSGNNVVQLGGGMLDLTAPTFDASYLKATGSFTYRITGDISIASTCTDSICSSFDSLLGSAPIKITGTSGSDGFSFTAPLGDVQLSNDFTMTKATFEFNPGTDKQMGIVGEMNIATDDTLKMTSEISAVFEGSKVELNGNMVGIWSPGEFKADRCKATFKA